MPMKILCFLIFSFLVISCSIRTVHNWEEIKQDKLNAFWVTEILSGDKIRLSDGMIVQYLGIQAPLKNNSYFNISTQANAKLLGFSNPKDTNLHRRVVLKFHNPKSNQEGVYQAYVYYPIRLDPEKGIILRFVNKDLLEFGYAVVDPNTQHELQEEFVELQKIAQQEKRGIWEFKR